MLSANPQANTIKIKDVFESTIQNINPLTKEDLQKILIDSNTKSQLCNHTILVNVDEIEKV